MAGDEMGGKETQCAGIDALEGIDRWMEIGFGGIFKYDCMVSRGFGEERKRGIDLGAIAPFRRCPSVSQARVPKRIVECHRMPWRRCTNHGRSPRNARHALKFGSTPVLRRSLLFLTAALNLTHCKGSEQNSSTTSTLSSAPSASSAAAPDSPEAMRVHRPPPTREGGALVRSANDDALYLADEDHGVVRRIPLPFDPAIAYTTVAMPGLPAQVLALQDRVLITIRSEGGKPASLPKDEEDMAAAPSASASAKPAPRTPPKKKYATIPKSPTGPGLLLIMKPDAAMGLVEVGRVTLPGDAWGIAVTPDEKTALISSAWTHQVSAVDIASAKKLWSLDMRREPRAIVVKSDGKTAYVTHLVGGAITRIDDILGQPKTTPVNLPPSPLRSPSGKILDGTLAYSAVLSPEGNRLFVPRHAVGALGEAAWFGAATVDVLLTADDTPLAPMREAGHPVATSELTLRMRENNPHETPGHFPLADYTPFTVGRAVLYRKSTQGLVVISEGSPRIMEFDARTVDPTMFKRWQFFMGTGHDSLIPKPETCSAATGLAMSADEKIFWVYCRASNNVLEINTGDKAKIDSKSLEPQVKRLALEEDLLGADHNKGRRMFYDGHDDKLSGGLSCAGCHPEGRDDGHVWHETPVKARAGEAVNFLGDADQAPLDSTKAVGYARQTPMLAGRVAANGPYGWHGESVDLQARLRGGLGLHRWGPIPMWDATESSLVGRALFLTLFVRHGLIPPAKEVRELTEQEKKGKEVFNSEGTRCARCHVPETEYTDRMSYPFTPKVPPVRGFEDEPDQNYKTPSLFFVDGTAPYYHDGRASTLEVLIDTNGDRMGRTSHLSAEEKAALIAFLKTL